MNMQPGIGAVALVTQFEGLDLTAYPDPASPLARALAAAGLTGKAVPASMLDLSGAPWTCGYGHTGEDVKPGMVASMAQAIAWRTSDLAHAAAVVNAHVTVPINQNQFDALCDFVYNEGEGDFVTSTLLRMLNAGNYADAATQFDRWDIAGGVVIAGLERRRNAEKALFMKPMNAN